MQYSPHWQAARSVFTISLYAGRVAKICVFCCYAVSSYCLCRYPGNYAKYLELKADRLAVEDAEADRARTKLRKESEWMSRQPK